MFQEGEGGQHGEQSKADDGALICVTMGTPQALNQASYRQGQQCHGKREEPADRALTEVAGQVRQWLGPEIRVDPGDTKEQIQLGGNAREEQNKECPERKGVFGAN